MENFVNENKINFIRMKDIPYQIQNFAITSIYDLETCLSSGIIIMINMMSMLVRL